MNELLLGKVFLIDTQALISVMFWEGLVSFLVIFTSKRNVKMLRNEQLLNKSMLFRLLRSLGYFLFLYRGIFPDILSSTAANVLLLLAFCLDAQVLLQATKLNTDRLKKYGWVTFALFSFLYVASDVVLGMANLRIVIASLGIFMTFAPAVLKCMFGKNSTKLYRSFLWPHLILITLAIPRAIVGIINLEYTLLETDVLQSMFHGFLLMKAFFCTLFLFVTLLSNSSNEIDHLVRDPLTGLNNRKAFIEQATKVFCKRRQMQGLFGVFFLDVDLFKKINDEWGHDKGDEILVAVADAVQCSVDVNDICCRYGGDEFVICTAFDDVNIGMEIGKRLQEQLYRIDIIPDCRITSSIGFVYDVPKDNECIEDYIKKADGAMYLSKRNGRDQMVALRLKDS